MREAVSALGGALRRGIGLSALVLIPAFAAFWWFAERFGGKSKERKHERGAMLVTLDELEAEIDRHNRSERARELHAALGWKWRLGVRARNQIEYLIRQSGERPEYGVIRGGPASSSSIIMQIGDLRISEWSDNGSCRFWSDSDPNAPKLYAKIYDGAKLRTTAGRSGFEYESHVPASPGWEGKFAGIIHRRTSILHPRFGKGRGRNWNDRW